MQLNRSVRGLALLLALAIGAPALAADKDLGQRTLAFMSIDNFKAYKQATKESDFGRFMEDPQVQEIWRNLKTGFTKLISGALSQASSEEQEAINAATALATEYCAALDEHATGRVAVSFGFVDVEGAMQPDLLIHIQGGEAIDTQHQRIYEFLTKAFEGQPVQATSTTLAGVTFKAFEILESPPPVPVKAPDGLYMGRKGNDYYIGISKQGIREYIEASTGSTAANRLGMNADYQRAVATAGRGQVNFFMNMGGFLDIVSSIGRQVPGGEAEMAEMNHALSAMGLDTMGVMLLSASIDASGTTTGGFFGLEGRKGLMKFVPTTNPSLTMPNFVPREVVNASAMSMRLDQTLNIIEEIAVAVGGDMAKQQMAGMFGQVEAQLGQKISDIVESWEGTVVSYTEPSAGAPAGGNPMMAMGAPTNMVLGIRLKDSNPMKKLVDTLSGHPELGAAMRTSEFMDHTLHMVNLAGDTPPEFAAGIPTPAFTIHKDWFLLGLSVESLQTSLRTAMGGEEGRLVSSDDFKRARGTSTGNAMMITFADQAKALGDMVDTLRPLIGFMPMLIPDIGQNPDLLFLFNANNLPQRDLFERYFGTTCTTCSVVDGGIQISSRVPSVSKPK